MILLFRRLTELRSSRYLPNAAWKSIHAKGKGVPYLRGNGRGDQKIILNVVVPTH